MDIPKALSSHTTTNRDLVSKNFLKNGNRLIWKRRGLQVEHFVIVSSSGIKKTEDGELVRRLVVQPNIFVKPVVDWLAWTLESSEES